jgi:hypothetical protein
LDDRKHKYPLSGLCKPMRLDAWPKLSFLFPKNVCCEARETPPGPPRKVTHSGGVSMSSATPVVTRLRRQHVDKIAKPNGITPDYECGQQSADQDGDRNREAGHGGAGDCSIR